MLATRASSETPRAIVVGALIAGLAIALAGCTSDAASTPAPSDGVSASPSDADGDGGGSGDEGTGDDGESDDDSAAPADPFDPACLIGDWVISGSEMQRFYDDATADIAEVSFTVDGDTGLSFDGEQYVYTPDFSLELVFDGLGDGTGTTSGSLTGSYVADVGVLTTLVQSNDLAVSVEILGQTVDGTDTLGSIIASDPLNEAAFDCSGGSPVIQFDYGSGTTPITLSPAG